MSKTIIINKNDNVAVALAPIISGEALTLGNAVLTAANDVMQGHKIAVKPIKAGEDIIKYGFPIGHATTDILGGEHVHIHNMKTSLSGEGEYTYNPAINPPVSVQPESFMGYMREDGRAAIRNELWIIPGVGCINGICERLARESSALAEEFGLDGIHALTHPYGCSQLGDDLENTRRLLASLANHPNAGGVLIVSLGCENNIPDDFKEEIISQAGDSYNSDRIKFMVCQELEDELEHGAMLLRRLAEHAGKAKRQPVPVSKLVVAMKCGGSDGLSGITANPLLGLLGDMITARGGSNILTEVPEMFGAEAILLNRCVNKKVFDDAVKMIKKFKAYFTAQGQPVYENPAPGNYAGGISSLEDKSLGCVQKGGTAAVSDVIDYGGQIRKKGLSLLYGPGNDLISTANLAAAGAHIIFFSTGRGTPYSTVVPTVKVSTNTALYEKKPGWIDFDAGTIASGESLDDAAKRLYSYTLKLAGGEKTKSEENGYREIQIFKNGVIL